MRTISRRALLRGVAAGAGGALLLPIMSRLTFANPPPVMRFVFIVEGNCFEPVTMLNGATRAWLNSSLATPLNPDTRIDRWWYNSYRHTGVQEIADTHFETAPALGAIATNNLQSDTTVIYGLSSEITGGGHSASHGALSSTRTVGGLPGGPTIDAALAAVASVRGMTPFDAVRLGIMYDLTQRLNYGTCAFEHNRPAPLIVEPTAAYSVLFGLVGSASDMASFDERGRLLDFADMNVTAALGAFSGNSAERAKVESYLAAVQEVSQRQQRLIALRPTLSAVRPTPPATNPLYAHSTATNNDPVSRFGAQIELATAALKGDLTNVVVIGSGTGGWFDMLYPSATLAAERGVMRHPLHHGSASIPDYCSTIHDITRQQMNYIAGMAAALKSTPDPANGGNMLDSTVIIYIGDNGEQHHSTASEFPIVMIGGSGIGLRPGGRTLVYPGIGAGMAHRQVSNLWNTLGHLTGAAPFALSPRTHVDFNLFGNEGPHRIASGPLSELLA